MHSTGGDTTQLVPGFPIRTPWDHSSVDSSPRPIAASHVLHRLLVPRHPPYALSNLTTQNKMLASTVQFSTNTQPTPHTTTRQRQPPGITADADRLTQPATPEGADAGCLRTPTGCLPTTRQPQPPTRSTPRPATPEGTTRHAAVLAVEHLRPAGPSPVSPPSSTPPPHSGGAGSWTVVTTARRSLERR